jgi:hypothetical protein
MRDTMRHRFLLQPTMSRRELLYGFTVARRPENTSFRRRNTVCSHLRTRWLRRKVV